MPFIDRAGQRIHYTVTGEGPPVLLAHSFLCSGLMWEPQIAGLKDRYQLIAVDARGHGQSGNVAGPFTMWDAALDHLAVLDELGIESVAWAGLSQGGMAGMRAALSHPERVRGLMLLDTDGGPESRFIKTKYTFMKIAARAVGIGPLLPAVGPIMFGRTTLKTKRDVVKTWNERFRTLDVPSMLLGIDAVRFRDDLFPRLGEISVPCLVLVGSEDKALIPARSRRLAAALKDATFVEVAGAGHLSAQEAPEEVTKTMSDFLAALYS
jgi:3-oxoadipate enol-lactonase